MLPIMIATGCHFTGPVALRRRISPVLPLIYNSFNWYIFYFTRPHIVNKMSTNFRQIIQQIWHFKNIHIIQGIPMSRETAVIRISSPCTGDSSQERTMHFSEEYIPRKTGQKYKEYILSLFDPIQQQNHRYSAVTKEMVIAGLKEIAPLSNKHYK